MKTTNYYVVDLASELYSQFYDSYDEAKNDLDNDISHVWSTDAVICECTAR